MQNGNGKRKYVIDIDGTICTQDGTEYANAVAKHDVIAKVNKLYDEGNTIVLFTARGYETGIDWSETTLIQLQLWGVKYHDLIFGKPSADVYVDDKACHVDDFMDINTAKHVDCITVIDKIWGKEYLLDITPKYAMKRLCIDAGKNISLQYHKQKRETWHIVSGEGVAKIHNEIYHVQAGNTISIPVGTVHQIKATTDLVLIESSTIELDDIVRIREDF